MRISIHADSATPRQLSDLASALYLLGLGAVEVTCDGPEKFKLATPKMGEQDFAALVGHLVKFNGKPLVTYFNREVTREGITV